MKPRGIDEGLVLRNACPEDMPALTEHIRSVHGEEVIGILKAVYELHPLFSWEDSFVITNPDSGLIVSSLVLIRNSWMLAGVEFPSAEMGIVGTLKEHRYRGLIRLLNDEFEKRVHEIQPIIQAVAGIPHFYRNFGYEYAAPLGGEYPVASELIPALSEDEEESANAVEVDAASFQQFLEFRASHLPEDTWKRTMRTEDYEYHAFAGCDPPTEAFFFYLLQKDAKTVGVFILNPLKTTLNVLEVYLDSPQYLDSILRFSESKAQTWGGLQIQVASPSQQSVRDYLRTRTVDGPIARYGWYIKIPSIQRFLDKIGPLLSARLERSEYRNLEGELTVTDYNRGYSLQFKNGEFRGVTRVTERDPNRYDLRLPQNYLTRLLMGFETLDELRSHEPDVICISAQASLVRVLFPKLDATVDPAY